MQLLFSFILFIGIFFLPQNCCAVTPQLSHTVLVSLAPYKFFVEKIAGDSVKAQLMVPAGASAHTYEPTPKEMLAASKADAWFTIGEPFETKAGKALQNHHPSLQLIDLNRGVDLISAHEHRCCHQCKSAFDTHVWLSPRQVKVQAEHIGQTLMQLYPENQELYRERLKTFLENLDRLDKEITEQLGSIKQRVIMASHPAYAYFCRDYGLKQLSVEFEGKDPTPQQLTRVIEAARQNKIRVIFIQPQYHNKGARLIAETIGAKVVSLDPYAEDYFTSMRAIAKQIVDAS